MSNPPLLPANNRLAEFLRLLERHFIHAIRQIPGIDSNVLCLQDGKELLKSLMQFSPPFVAALSANGTEPACFLNALQSLDKMGMLFITFTFPVLGLTFSRSFHQHEALLIS